MSHCVNPSKTPAALVSFGVPKRSRLSRLAAIIWLSMRLYSYFLLIENSVGTVVSIMVVYCDRT